jgi:hypothetical protein
MHFDNDMEIKHELVHCLKELKQHDKLLSFFSLWVENLLADNSLWWREIYKIVEKYFTEEAYDRVRELIDGFEKKTPYMGGPELKSRFYDLKKKSMETMLQQSAKP